MNDIEFVITKLKADAKKKQFPQVQVATGLTQRTMDNLVKGKTDPSAKTLTALLKHYKPAKKVKK